MENDVLLPSNLNVIIEGRHILLKPITQKEVNEEYLSWLNNTELNKYLEIRFRKQELKDIPEYINSIRHKKGCEVFGIFTKKDLLHVGNISITECDLNNGTAIYGMIVGNPKAQAIGLGGEAAGLLIEFLFKNSKIRKVGGGVIEDNYKSWKTCESLGLKREGVKKKHCVLLDGKITDSYFYSIFREEWEESKKNLQNIFGNIKIKYE